jgi:thiol-disulfide isomerase/thioredoxin
MHFLIKRLLICFLAVLLSSSVPIQGAEDLDLAAFKATVLTDEKVWAVEFYSSMCGSCKEFNPTWTKVEKSLKSIATTKVNIDTKEGMEIAKELGVLEEGIPNLRLFSNLKSTSSNRIGSLPKGTTIMSGQCNLC